MNTIKRSIFPYLLNALDDRRVIVVTGMRRVGKTTTLQWLLDQVQTTNKIFMDLERLDLRAVFEETNYERILTYFRNQGLNPAKPLTVALDEIQNVKNLPSVVKYLSDHYDIKFLLTGSSSYTLKNFFTESLAGRKIVFELFPLTFGEFLDFHSVPYRTRASFEDMQFDFHEYERIAVHYSEYLRFGGLPGVVLESKPDIKREILNDIFSSYINIDVRTMADFRKIGELQALLKILTSRIGNKLDLSKLAKIVGISRPTLNEYLEFLEATYIIHRMPAYAGPEKTVALGKKLYFRDNGIAGILGELSEGALFENAVFNQLRSYGELAYLSKANDFEMDFVLTPDPHTAIGLEAKIHPTEIDLRRLKRIAHNYNLSGAWLIGRQATPGFKEFLWGGSIF
jgi:predicted AAA+ superfamily ATPase